jgi:uncharacterized membrane protein YgcG
MVQNPTTTTTPRQVAVIRWSLLAFVAVVVLLVFAEPRLARIDVGYGLEDRLPDARVRQLLDTHLSPAFERGEYERGFNALIFAMRKELGGDDANSIHARAAEARRRADVPWFSQVGTALARIPRVVAGTVDAFLEEGPATRIPILVAAGVVLAIAAFVVAMAVNTVWRVVTPPAKIRSRKASGTDVAVATSVFEIAMGVGGFLIGLTPVMILLLAAESFFIRKGSFSGAGGEIVWSAPSRWTASQRPHLLPVSRVS